MRIIEPLGNEEEILREAADSPRRTSDEQAAPVAVPISALQPDTPPLAPWSPEVVPSPPLQRKRNNWLFVLAVATILTNSSLVMHLLVTPSDTHMLLAGRPLFALPIPGDPEALSHPVDYLTIGLAVVQIVLAFFIVKFRAARIAIAYVAIATLCLSIRAWMLALSLPEGEYLWLTINPLYWAVGFLTGYVNTYIITGLLASYLIPLALLITVLVMVFRDWRNARNFSQPAQSRKSEFSA